MLKLFNTVDNNLLEGGSQMYMVLLDAFCRGFLTISIKHK